MLNFNEVQCFRFFLDSHALACVLKRALPNSHWLTPTLMTLEFYSVGSYVYARNLFSCNCHVWYKKWVQIYCFIGGYLVIWAQFIEKTKISPTKVSWHPCQKSIDFKYKALFQEPTFHKYIYIYICVCVCVCVCVYIHPIDYAKVFDCVDLNKLWKILKEMGIPDHLTCLLSNLYAGQKATVRTGHGTTDWFQIRKGVRQGCIL